MSDETTAEGLLRDWIDWFESGEPKHAAPSAMTRRYLAKLWGDDEQYYGEYEEAIDREDERRLNGRGAFLDY